MNQPEFWQQAESLIVPRFSPKDKSFFLKLKKYDPNASKVMLATIIAKNHPWDRPDDFWNFIAYINGILLELAHKAKQDKTRFKIFFLISEKWKTVTKNPKKQKIN